MENTETLVMTPDELDTVLLTDSDVGNLAIVIIVGIGVLAGLVAASIMWGRLK